VQYELIAGAFSILGLAGLDKLETKPGQFAFNPTITGGSNYDLVYQRLQREGNASQDVMAVQSAGAIDGFLKLTLSETLLFVVMNPPAAVSRRFAPEGAKRP
jgi:hypothetical protein